VLLPRREPSTLVRGVAPGNPLVGLMLPYTPLHHLLLRDAGRPLVMTSGNLSDEPIVHRNEDAVRQLGPLADLLVLHDRDIVTRCDDSVARVIGGAATLVRRSRGYVPRAVHLARPVARPVLAVGALLKNACCLARGDEAFMGPHVGDLDNLETFRAFEEAVARLVRFVGATPEVIACDLHPGYHSTRLAREWPGEVVRVGVQHHHAHIAAVIAEHGLDGPVIGVAYDGTGYGTDGTAWGGEVLIADAVGFRRVATLRPLALPGVDAAIRAPWRIALAALDDACGGEAPLDGLPLFAGVPAREIAVVRQMVRAGLQTARAHGAGRYFDVAGALLLGRRRATYEGQLALEVNAAADPEERGHYPFALAEAGGVLEVDLRPMLRALVDEVRGGAPLPRMAGRFHRTLGAATAAVVARVVAAEGALPIALSGGCFQNALLVEDLLERLPAGRVHQQRQVPPGDGGLALGQAWVANAVAERKLGSGGSVGGNA
jgi:hydrogenase maturation protein HypF